MASNFRKICRFFRNGKKCGKRGGGGGGAKKEDMKTIMMNRFYGQISK